MAREDDSISRKEVLQMIDNIREAGGFIGFNTYSEAFDQVSNMSSVPRWIPVTERLPEPQANGGDKDLSEWVLVSLSTSKFDTVCGAFYCFSEKKWYRERVAFGTVTAWMPLPKPYKENKE